MLVFFLTKIGLFFCFFGLLSLNWCGPLPLAQVWTHYKIRELNMWTLFCNECIEFFWTPKFERKSCLNWMASFQNLNPKPSSVSHVLNWFLSFQKPGFLEFIWNFHSSKSLENLISPTFWIQIFYQINSIKSFWSWSFQQHQRHIPIPPKFSVTI
jgi:hypothetical protein